jgi:GTPase involved in cell partitioning and DNA repair
MGRDGKVKTIVVPVGTIVREVHRRYVVNGADIDQDGGEDELLAYGDSRNDNLIADKEDIYDGEGGNEEEGGEKSINSSSSMPTEGRGRLRGRRRRNGRGGEGEGLEKTSALSSSSSEEQEGSTSIVSIPLPVDIDKLRSMRELPGGGGQNLSSSSSSSSSSLSSSSNNDGSSKSSTELVRTNKSGLVFKEKTDFLIDLDSPGQSILVAEGGAPGVGNKGSLLTYSEQRQDELRPHITGGKGVVRFLELELKIIADVGLVGFPNAGKSSFLASVSKVSIV